MYDHKVFPLSHKSNSTGLGALAEASTEYPSLRAAGWGTVKWLHWNRQKQPNTKVKGSLST